jgi:RNA polymerase sigma-70 factor (ECF subfamily)
VGPDSDPGRAVARARAGEEEAWAELYEELSPAVLGYLRARNAPSPEDVCGEVFIQVVRDIERFDGTWSGFRAWVFSIANNRLIDAKRHAARRPASEPLEHESVLGEAPGADDEAFARIGAENVREILEGLSEDQQTVLTLRIIGGLTIEEIAGVVDKRVGAVKALQRRALRRVRKDLEQGRTPLIEESA